MQMKKKTTTIIYYYIYFYNFWNSSLWTIYLQKLKQAQKIIVINTSSVLNKHITITVVLKETNSKIFKKDGLYSEMVFYKVDFKTK